jgi:glycosyltransferase involved in cell wall biosynthesis
MHGARNVGGGEYKIYLLIIRLNRDIFRPIVFYANENAITEKLKTHGIELVKIPIDARLSSLYRSEVRINPISCIIYGGLIIKEVLSFAKYLKKYNVVLLHPHDNLSKIIGALAAKLSHVKTVTHCHDLLNKSFIERFLLYFQIIFFDKIIADSENTRNIFRIGGRIPRKVKMIYNGFDFDSLPPEGNLKMRQELKIEEEKFVIGIIGLFDACKGHIYLFQALEKLIFEQKKDIVCLVIGDGRMNDQLREFVKTNKLENHVKFLGYRNDVLSLLGIIDLVVIPSVQESFGVVCLEAMAMKVPVVASRIGGLPEIVIPDVTGILVPPKDVAALTSAIGDLYHNRQKGRSMGEAGRKRVKENFRLDEDIRKTEEVYLDVLKADKKS